MDDIHPGSGCVATGDEHAVWTYIKHTRAYGALTKKASAVDAMAIKRAATEKNFIASLYGVRRMQGEGTDSGWIAVPRHSGLM